MKDGGRGDERICRSFKIVVKWIKIVTLGKAIEYEKDWYGSDFQDD